MNRGIFRANRQRRVGRHRHDVASSQTCMGCSSQSVARSSATCCSRVRWKGTAVTRESWSSSKSPDAQPTLRSDELADDDSASSRGFARSGLKQAPVLCMGCSSPRECHDAIASRGAAAFGTPLGRWRACPRPSRKMPRHGSRRPPVRWRATKPCAFILHPRRRARHVPRRCEAACKPCRGRSRDAVARRALARARGLGHFVAS